VRISITDLRGAQPADATLQNLLSVLKAKLELCSRLPIFEYEAQNEGHATAAAAFRALAEVERRSFDELLECLRKHLDERAQEEPGAAPHGGLVRP
jgi:AcrR family transcriptional regulator